MSAKLTQVIEVHTTRGKGLDASDPIRSVLQFWTPDGELLIDDDKWQREESASVARRAYAFVCALDTELSAEVFSLEQARGLVKKARHAMEGRPE